ncbi:hypothetical protein GPALN_014561 [Globodera pallida]|uniref:LETM1 domain-containing protein n=1 Tax=Globodera pallida TaxID=36090 RepID=A0A183BR77_GLOPA|nr:hypothetical protein GPALN_014561 [Globodera pallida]
MPDVCAALREILPVPIVAMFIVAPLIVKKRVGAMQKLLYAIGMLWEDVRQSSTMEETSRPQAARYAGLIMRRQDNADSTLPCAFGTTIAVFQTQIQQES